MTKKLQIKQEGRAQWWVENIDDTREIFCGPYKNRDEAVEAREGLLRTWESETWQEIEREWETRNLTQKPSENTSKSLLTSVPEVVLTPSVPSQENQSTPSQSSSPVSKSLLSGFGFGLI